MNSSTIARQQAEGKPTSIAGMIKRFRTAAPTSRSTREDDRRAGLLKEMWWVDHQHDHERSGVSADGVLERSHLHDIEDTHGGTGVPDHMPADTIHRPVFEVADGEMGSPLKLRNSIEELLRDTRTQTYRPQTLLSIDEYIEQEIAQAQLGIIGQHREDTISGSKFRFESIDIPYGGIVEHTAENSLDFTGFKALLLPHMALANDSDDEDTKKQKEDPPPPPVSFSATDVQKDMAQTIEHLRKSFNLDVQEIEEVKQTSKPLPSSVIEVNILCHFTLFNVYTCRSSDHAYIGRSDVHTSNKVIPQDFEPFQSTLLASYKNQQDAEKKEQVEREKNEKAMRLKIKEELQEERILKALDDASVLFGIPRPVVQDTSNPVGSTAQDTSKGNPKVPQLPLPVRRGSEELKLAFERLPDAEEAVRRMKLLHEQVQESMQKLRLMEDEYETHELMDERYLRLSDLRNPEPTNEDWLAHIDSVPIHFPRNFDSAPMTVTRNFDSAPVTHSRPPLYSVGRDQTVETKEFSPLPVATQEIQRSLELAMKTCVDRLGPQEEAFQPAPPELAPINMTESDLDEYFEADLAQKAVSNAPKNTTSLHMSQVFQPPSPTQCTARGPNPPSTKDAATATASDPTLTPQILPPIIEHVSAKPAVEPCMDKVESQTQTSTEAFAPNQPVVPPLAEQLLPGLDPQSIHVGEHRWIGSSDAEPLYLRDIPVPHLNGPFMPLHVWPSHPSYRFAADGTVVLPRQASHEQPKSKNFERADGLPVLPQEETRLSTMKHTSREGEVSEDFWQRQKRLEQLRSMRIKAARTYGLS